MAEAYSDFAAVYDELMDNIPYNEWFSYLHALLKENKIEKGIIAELGCGTGTLTEMLASAGYDMIGIDNAPAMLDIANSKKQANNSNTLYLCQDMREFELFGTVACVISLCDSINYILDKDDLLDVFRLVNNYLDTDGIFIFDFHTRYYYEEIVADATIAEDRDDISFIWDNYYDAESNINELALSLFIRDRNDPSIYRKHEELHEQYGYTLCEMKTLIEKSGLTLLMAYDASTHNPATEQSERIYMIAKENTTSGKKKDIANAYVKKHLP